MTRNYQITTVKTLHPEGQVRCTEHFNYDADCAFTALRIWLQTNFKQYSTPPGSILFIAIHPSGNLSDAASINKFIAEAGQSQFREMKKVNG